MQLPRLLSPLRSLLLLWLVLKPKKDDPFPKGGIRRLLIAGAISTILSAVLAQVIGFSLAAIRIGPGAFFDIIQTLRGDPAKGNELLASLSANKVRSPLWTLFTTLVTAGLLEELFKSCDKTDILPRFGEIAVKDAKFRTFIADAAARREFYKHVYDVTYGLIDKEDTLVVMDDSIVRGNTMRNAIIPMLSRLGPKRIVIVSSAPPIRYPDCYGIDMSTLGELVAFRALVNLLGEGAEKELWRAAVPAEPPDEPPGRRLSMLYARFTEEQHAAEIARLLTPPGTKAEVKVVYQTVENLRQCLQPPRHQTNEPPNHPIGDWYFTGDYPTPGGYKVLRKALLNYLEKNSERSY